MTTTTEPLTFIQLTSNRKNSAVGGGDVECWTINGRDVDNQVVDDAETSIAQHGVALRDSAAGRNVEGNFAVQDVANQDMHVDATDMQSVTSL